MEAEYLIRTGSLTSRPNTPLGESRLSRSASLSPRPSLQANLLNEGSSSSSSSSPPPPPSSSSSSVLRLARSEFRVVVPARVAEEQEEEMEYSGGGSGKGRKVGGARGGEHSENWRMRQHYQELLRNDPTNPLLLRNHGKFLHEVEGEVERAEENYGRAILASPEDGELLSLYGKLVWETERDAERAGAYFLRALEASPHDCYVLGSYAHFLWDTEEANVEEEKARKAVPFSPLEEAL